MVNNLLQKKEHVKACSPRLIEIMNKVSPSLVVLLGKTATKYYPGNSPIVIDLVHPSFILQYGSRELDKKRFILTLRKAIESLRQ